MKTTRPRACTFESEAAKTQNICCGQVADFTKAYRLGKTQRAVSSKPLDSLMVAAGSVPRVPAKNTHLARQDSGACRLNSGRALIVDPPSSWEQLSTKPTEVSTAGGGTRLWIPFCQFRISPSSIRIPKPLRDNRPPPSSTALPYPEDLSIFSASRRRLYSNPRSLYTESLVCAKNRHVSIRQLLVAPLPRPVDAQSPPDVHRTPGSASQVQARFGRLVWKRKLWLVFAGLTGQRFEILERFLKKLPPSPSELSRHHHLNHLLLPAHLPHLCSFIRSPSPSPAYPLTTRNPRPSRVVSQAPKPDPPSPTPDPSSSTAPPSRPTTSPARFPCAPHPEVYIKSREFN